MKPKKILIQWVALETGDGLQRVQEVSRRVSIASVALCIGTTTMALWFWPPALAFMLSGIVIGWLIGERNRLATRKTVWPTVREYLDWPRIHQDATAAIAE